MIQKPNIGTEHVENNESGRLPELARAIDTLKKYHEQYHTDEMHAEKERLISQYGAARYLYAELCSEITPRDSSEFKGVKSRDVFMTALEGKPYFQAHGIQSGNYGKIEFPPFDEQALHQEIERVSRAYPDVVDLRDSLFSLTPKNTANLGDEMYLDGSSLNFSYKPEAFEVEISGGGRRDTRKFGSVAEAKSFIKEYFLMQSGNSPLEFIEPDWEKAVGF